VGCWEKASEAYHPTVFAATDISYFFRKEQSSGMRRLFSGIRNAQGIIVRSISAILHVWCLYYVHLFTASSLSQPGQDFFLDSLDLKLSAAESSLCEGDVLNAECLAALKGFKNNKSINTFGTYSVMTWWMCLTRLWLLACYPFPNALA
jgi:hypothetical protein